MKNPINKNKKEAEKPKKPRASKNIDELIKSQLNLFQFCNSLSSKNHLLELKVQNLHHETVSLKRDNEELKKILELIGRKITELRDRMNGDDEHQSESKTTHQEHPKEIKKLPPLHDDVITRCKMCEKIYHIKYTSCPFCGYTKK